MTCTSAFMMTVQKSDKLPAEAFQAGRRLMDDELAALKACMEKAK
jgi:hypothetical protein